MPFYVWNTLYICWKYKKWKVGDCVLNRTWCYKMLLGVDPVNCDEWFQRCHFLWWVMANTKWTVAVVLALVNAFRRTVQTYSVVFISEVLDNGVMSTDPPRRCLRHQLPPSAVVADAVFCWLSSFPVILYHRITFTLSHLLCVLLQSPSCSCCHCSVVFVMLFLCKRNVSLCSRCYAPAPIGKGNKRWFCPSVRLSVYPSVTYITNDSRTHRPSVPHL